MRFNGKIAVIFAAGGAVAGAVAEAIAREGAAVFVSGRHRERVQEVADKLRREGLAAVGDVAAFLASDAASAIAGQVVDFSCGQVVT